MTLTSKDVIDIFKIEFPREDLELIFGLDSDYDTGRKVFFVVDVFYNSLNCRCFIT